MSCHLFNERPNWTSIADARRFCPDEFCGTANGRVKSGISSDGSKIVMTRRGNNYLSQASHGAAESLIAESQPICD
jgi:hypothetical protein